MTAVRVLLVSVALAWSAALAAAQEAQAPAPQENSAPVLPSDTPTYQAAGRRDPFRPFILDIKPEIRAQSSPLQRYELGQLIVVATVWELNPPRAMVEDNLGMGYILGIGTPIGRNGGVVTAIEPEKVVVEERVLDFYGKEQVNRIVLETPKEEGTNQLTREPK